MSALDQKAEPSPRGGRGGSGLLAVPAFEAGGRVERTGIALVHQGEFIMPAPGSEAVVSAASGGSAEGTVVHYHFPVEIEIMGSLDERQLRHVAKYVYEDLQAEFDSRGLR